METTTEPGPPTAPEGRSISRGRLGLLLVVAVALVGVGAILQGVGSPPGRVERVTVETPRGPLAGLYWRPPGEGPFPGVLLGHGSACSKETMRALARPLVAAGTACLAIDYGSHGESYAREAGAPNEELNDRDTKRGLFWLARRPEVDPRRVGLVGHSFGATTASRAGGDMASREGLPRVRAVAALGQLPVATPDLPPDLLVGVGAFDPYHPPARMVEALVAAWPSDRPVEPGRRVGDLEAGTARLLVVDPSADHAGELYSPRTLDEVAAWMSGAIGAGTPPPASLPWAAFGAVLACAGGIVGGFAAGGATGRLAGPGGRGLADRVAPAGAVALLAVAALVSRGLPPAGPTVAADAALGILLAIPLLVVFRTGADLRRAAGVLVLVLLAYPLGGLLFAAPWLTRYGPGGALEAVVRQVILGDLYRAAVLVDIGRADAFAVYGPGRLLLAGPLAIGAVVAFLAVPARLGRWLTRGGDAALRATDLRAWLAGDGPDEAPSRRTGAIVLLVVLLAVAAWLLLSRVREGYLRDPSAWLELARGAFRFLGAPVLVFLGLRNLPGLRRLVDGPASGSGGAGDGVDEDGGRTGEGEEESDGT